MHVDILSSRGTVNGLNERAQFTNGFFCGPLPRLFAHRGASARAPENTIEAFRIAWEQGAPYLELDVRLSADGHVVVMHDSSVRRTTGSRGRVEMMSLDAIRKLDAGRRFTPDRGLTFPYRERGITVPLFEEILEAFPLGRLNIEIKRSREGIEKAVTDAIYRWNASDRILIAAREQDILERFRGLDRTVLTGFSKKEIRRFIARVRAGNLDDYTPQGGALQVPERHRFWRIVSPRFVEAAHRLGIEVHVWTVNDPARIERLLRWGVDGIMTDDPARALASVAALSTSRREGR